jgi:hypothetical protein
MTINKNLFDDASYQMALNQLNHLVIIQSHLKPMPLLVVLLLINPQILPYNFLQLLNTYLNYILHFLMELMILFHKFKILQLHHHFLK